jgi:hypothetical protein
LQLTGFMKEFGIHRLAGLLVTVIANLAAPGLITAQPTPVEAELRAALENGGLVKWDKDGIIPLALTIPITRDAVLDGTDHSVTIDGQNQVRVFLVSSNVHFTLLNITVANGRADQGGGLLNKGGTVNLSNCVFTGNQSSGAFPTDQSTAAARGGAIYSVGGEIDAINCLFTTNTAVPAAATNGTVVLEARGGALGIDHGVLRLMNCQFTTNQASGGIQYLYLGPVADPYGPGTGGSAFGGAVCLVYSTGYVRGCRFSRNLAQSPLMSYSAQRADVLGGALHQEGTGLLQLEDCVFEANQAVGGGGFRGGLSGDGRGGAVSTYGSLVADTCSFHGNSCIGGGGASFSGGNAFGGALFATNTATLNQCLFDQNSALGGSGCACGIGLGTNGFSGGGAVYAQGSLQILNTTFAFNSVGLGDIIMGPPPLPQAGSSAGGALFSAAVCVATNSTWFQNQIKVQGKQLFAWGSPSYTEGAVAGAATYQTGNPLTLVNCTVASNLFVNTTNVAVGAAVEAATNTVAQLSACLLSQNLQGNLAGNIVDQGFNLSSDHNVLLTNATSHNDIDPKLGDFGDHGGPTPTLALLPGSPAIDAITSGPCPATDQRGVARPISAGCDIGAFEFQFVPAPILSLDLSGTFRVQEVLQPASDYQIDVSTNLTDWTLFTTNRTDDLGILKFTDTTVTNVPHRFYRVVPKD